MSQLLGRIAKLSSSLSSVGKHGLCFSESRVYSTAAAAAATATTPYLLFIDSNRRRGASDETMVVDMNLYDPRKQERLKIPDQTLSKELEDSVLFGSSRGWAGFRHIDDFSIRITNIHNPSASVSSHKVFSFPQISGRIWSFSLSASPNQQEDFVVAAMTTTSSISLCRPGDSEWTPVKVPFLASDMMYSVRDRRFYLHRDYKEEYKGPIDFIDTSCSDFPQVSLLQGRFPVSDIPKSIQDQLISTYQSQYIVESPSGESFIVSWFKYILEDKGLARIQRAPFRDTYTWKIRAFLVFREDPEQKIGCYTQDIGDLCIFLGRNEAFCVSATQYPGLNPNSVYFSDKDMGFGYYDLSSGILHGVIDPISNCSLWLAPLQ